MAFECHASFVINFAGVIEPSITLVAVEVSRFGSTAQQENPAFASKWRWLVRFVYVTGDPPATAFRLNSADGLTGGFDPTRPQRRDDPNEVQNGVCQGIVTRVPGVEGDITYAGTITIL